MIELITNRGDLKSELFEVARCFVAEEKALSINFTHIRYAKNVFYITVNERRYTFSYALCFQTDRLLYVRYDVYTCKLALYRALSAYFARELPWGSLTGIRPTRIAARLLQGGVPLAAVPARMCEEYAVSREKAELTARILSVQSATIADRMYVAAPPDTDPASALVNLYVHIPFCPTRCAYCSFVSEGIEKKKWLLLPYAEALTEEIRRTKELIASEGKKIFSVYVGGGTPTVLPPDLLGKVLRAAWEEGAEYTCEAGRPDTITEEKLRVLDDCGVNRISINPQTLHDRTLVAVGRAHTVDQFYRAYAAAEKFGFCKNVDIIAGLQGETEEDFRQTLSGITALSPENITVHTLCRKRGSADALRERKENGDTENMVRYSVSALSECGYEPYYLYRQKQMTANLENIGWCKPHCLCVNNVTVMEETLSVYACGAGAIGKTVQAGGKIARFANPKDVLLYLNEFQERMAKKEAFYKING